MCTRQCGSMYSDTMYTYVHVLHAFTQSKIYQYNESTALQCGHEMTKISNVLLTD